MFDNNEAKDNDKSSLWKKFSNIAGGTFRQRLKLAIILMLIWIVGGTVWVLLEHSLWP